MKWIGRILGAILLVILLLVLAIPYFFKDDIKRAVLTEVNKNVDATVDIGDVGISLFKDFPNLSVSLQDVSVVGKGAFANQSLYKANNTSFSLNLSSVFNKATPYQINSILLDNPDIHIIVDKSGKANYDIYQGDASNSTAKSDEPTAFNLELDNYAVKNGRVIYDDQAGNVYANVAGLNHSGKGDFSQDIFDLKTKNDIVTLTVRMGGVSYAKDMHINGDVNVNVDMPNQKYTFADNKLNVNDLDLAYNGHVQTNGDAIDVDIDFNAPNNNLKSILSLVPAVYKQDFASLKANGNTNLRGIVRGRYIDGKSYPAIKVNLGVDNGAIQYPDLPESITNLNTNITVEGKQTDLSDLTIDMPKLSMLMGNNPISARANIKNAMNNPAFDVLLDGKLDLGMVGKFVTVEDLKKLSGTADSHIELRGTYADIEQNNYSRILFNTDVKANDVEVLYAEYPPIRIPRSRFVGSPQQIRLEHTEAQLGKSDAQLDFSMSNPLAYAIAGKPAKANVKLVSRTLDANEWMAATADDSPKSEDKTPTTTQTDDTSVDAFVENLTVDYDARIDNILYEDYQIKNVKSSGRIDDKFTEVRDFSMLYNGTAFQAHGTLENGYGYALRGEDLMANLNLEADKINVNDYMSDTDSQAQTTTSSEPMTVIPIPKNVKAKMSTKIGQLVYDEYDVRNVRGHLMVEDQVATLLGLKGNTLGGQMKIDGTYDTKDINDPKYKLSYDVANLDIQQTFKTSTLFKKLAPFSQFIKGTFNNKMSVDGSLGQDMMPDFKTLSADGFFEILNGVVVSFPVLNEIGDKLNIREIKDWHLKDNRNWFEVKDGAVEVEDFTLEEKDMKFVIGGKHYIDNTMDYRIKAEVPRRLLNQSNVTGMVNTGLQWLQNEAKGVGVPISVGDYIYLDIVVTGTVTKPKIKIVPTGSGGKDLKTTVTDNVKDRLNTEKEKVMTRAEQELERRKQEALNRGEEVVGRVKEQAKQEVDRQVEQVKGRVKQEVNKVVKEEVVDTVETIIRDRAKDVLGDKAEEKVDNVIDAVKDFNPFKKRKKNGGG